MARERDRKAPWILDDESNVIVPHDPELAKEWWRKAITTVEFDLIRGDTTAGGAIIETRLMGEKEKDELFGLEAPFFFATKVYGGSLDQQFLGSRDIESAKDFHKAAVAVVNNSELLEDAREKRIRETGRMSK